MIKSNEFNLSQLQQFCKASSPRESTDSRWRRLRQHGPEALRRPAELQASRLAELPALPGGAPGLQHPVEVPRLHRLQVRDALRWRVAGAGRARGLQRQPGDRRQDIRVPGVFELYPASAHRRGHGYLQVKRLVKNSFFVLQRAYDPHEPIYIAAHALEKM